MAARGCGGLLLCVGLLFVTPALAAAPTDRDACAASADKPDLARMACGRIIDDAAESMTERAKAFAHRCEAHAGKEDHVAAIADCTQAINLDPNYAWAYNIRGVARFALDSRRRTCPDGIPALLGLVSRPRLTAKPKSDTVAWLRVGSTRLLIHFLFGQNGSVVTYGAGPPVSRGLRSSLLICASVGCAPKCSRVHVTRLQGPRQGKHQASKMAQSQAHAT